MRIEKIRHIITSVLFISIIVFVFINQSFKIVTGNMDTNENRTIAEKPKLDISRLDFFPKKYDKYYEDNFLFRADYISFNLFLSQKVFHKNDVKGNYIIGEDNWIFPMKRNLGWYSGEKDFNREQLDKFKIEFEKRQEYFNSIGIKMYLLVIPSKYNIYPDKLPRFLRSKRITWTDKFIGYLNQYTSVKIVDGRKSLKKRCKDQIVYLKYDTHWNTLGAFYVLSDLLDTMRKDFPEIPDYDLNDYYIDTVERKGNMIDLLANYKNLYELDYHLAHKGSNIISCRGYKHLKMDNFRYTQDIYCMRFCNKSAKNSLKVVLFRDSFMGCTNNFFTSNFKEVLYIWDNWQYMFNKEIIDIEKPDIVLYPFFEGYLDRILVDPSFVEPEFTLEELE